MAEAEMQRVMDGRRQQVSPCPRCQTLVGLWLKVMDREEFDRVNPTVDMTAALSPPQERAQAMARSADLAEYRVAAPWVCCLACGYDGMYQFGGGLPGRTAYHLTPGQTREGLERMAAAVDGPAHRDGDPGR